MEGTTGRREVPCRRVERDEAVSWQRFLDFYGYRSDGMESSALLSEQAVAVAGLVAPSDSTGSDSQLQANCSRPQGDRSSLQAPHEPYPEPGEPWPDIPDDE
jgi:hypothetical protein